MREIPSQWGSTAFFPLPLDLVMPPLWAFRAVEPPTGS